jgi:hypothetical protein
VAAIRGRLEPRARLGSDAQDHALDRGWVEPVRSRKLETSANERMDDRTRGPRFEGKVFADEFLP